jgi:hypothetical protein
MCLLCSALAWNVFRYLHSIIIHKQNTPQSRPVFATDTDIQKKNPRARTCTHLIKIGIYSTSGPACKGR